jgi:hypothetical protein
MIAFFFTVLVTQFNKNVHVYNMNNLEWMQVRFFEVMESNGLVVFVKIENMETGADY